MAKLTVTNSTPYQDNEEIFGMDIKIITNL